MVSILLILNSIFLKKNIHLISGAQLQYVNFNTPLVPKLSKSILTERTTSFEPLRNAPTPTEYLTFFKS